MMMISPHMQAVIAFRDDICDIMTKELTGGALDSVATFSHGQGAGDDEWAGSVLADNGCIYCIPRDNTQVLKIDPTDNSCTAFGSLSTAIDKYYFGCLAPNGMIYGFPRDIGNCIKIDPYNDTVSTIGSFTNTGNMSMGGCIMPDGNAYSMPRGQQTVIKIDTTTDTVSTLTISFTGTGDLAYGGCLAPNGEMYGSPSDVQLGRFNHITESITQFSFDYGTSLCKGIALAPTGIMYCGPDTDFMSIDPDTNTADDTLTYSGDWLAGGFYGAVTGPDGRIYFPSDDSPDIGYVDPSDESVGVFGSGLSVDGSHGGTMAPNNGEIYCPPRDISSIVRIYDASQTNPVLKKLCLSPYLNN